MLSESNPIFLWTYLGTLHPKISREYVSLATPPHYQVSIECNSQNQVLWLLATSLYSGILIIFVVFMATQTRHIKKAHFKGAKKVNLFIFVITIILSTTLSLWVVPFV
jgi:heme/copper-type cytochrome/quinol oxidase subunit 2